MDFRNRALHELQRIDPSAVAPHLHACDLEKDQILIEQDAPITQVHFPESALAANSVVFSDGASVDTAVVGLEGMTGLAPFMAAEPCAWRVRVLIPGRAYRMDADILRERLQTSLPMMNLMLRLTHDYQAQASQTGACNTRHLVRQRVSRWLLDMADRMGTSTLRLTQQDLADVLGMTRPSLQVEVAALRTAEAIDYRRGAITVNRVRLERFACECHRMDLKRSIGLGLDVPISS